MTANEIRLEALTRAKDGTSESNIPAILAGFAAKGIPEAEINPRENVFTFNAWLAIGRSVKKGEHGIKVHTWIERVEDGEKKRFPRSTTVFHISQTEEATGKPREPRTATPAPPRAIPERTTIPARFRMWADALQPKIDHASRPMTQNPTPKRNREYQSRLWEARNMTRTQKALRVMADAIDSHTLPVELDATTTRDVIAGMVHKGLDGSRGGYYSVVEAADYQNTTPAARTLQAMIAGNSREQANQAKKLKLQELEAAVKLSTIPGYFPTPAPLVEMMLEIAEIEPAHSVLEPSAGNGNIADAIREAQPNCDLDVCEINPRLAEILKLKGHNVVFQYPDFLDMPASPSFRYDRILMNPPFENKADMRHICEAYNHLNDTGLLVAILSPHFEFAQDRESVDFRIWLEEVGASWDEIPAGAFKQSGTNVASRLMVIDKRQN